MTGFTVNRLARGLEDINGRVREAAGEVFKEVSTGDVWGTPGSVAAAAIPELTLRLADPDLRVRRVARDSLRNIEQTGAVGDVGMASSPAIPQLLERVRDEEWLQREAALKTLGGLGVAAIPAIEDMIKCLVDPSRKVREAATACIEKLSACGVILDLHAYAAGAIPVLLASLRHESWELRAAAAWALGRAGGTAVLATHELLACMADENPAMRLLAVQALGRMGVSALCALPELADRLSDPSGRVREAAARALKAFAEMLLRHFEASQPGLLPVPHAVDQQSRRLRSDSPETRCAAAERIGEMGAPSLLVLQELLLLGVLDAEPRVAALALQSLKQLRQEGLLGAPGSATNTAVVTALLDTLNDEDHLVVLAALEALSRQAEYAAFAFGPSLQVLAAAPPATDDDDDGAAPLRPPPAEREGVFLRRVWAAGALVELGKVTRTLVPLLEEVLADDEELDHNCEMAEVALNGVNRLIDLLS